VITTINVNLQDFHTNALMTQMEKSQQNGETAVVMEVKTGEVKEIANLGRRSDRNLIPKLTYFALGHAGCSETRVYVQADFPHGCYGTWYADTSDIFDTASWKWEYGKRFVMTVIWTRESWPDQHEEDF
jgi:cell division protein FtsI (penicillin-binding protein 3)